MTARRMAPLPLRTARLLLRAPRLSDERELRYYTDPEVCRYLQIGPLDEAGLRHRIEKLLAADAPTEPGDVLSVIVEHDGTVVGDLMIRLGARIAPTQPPSIAEIGWVLAREHHGRGFATEAVRALIDLAFDHYPLHRVVAHLDPGNTASARLCERMGMRHEAHLRREYPTADGSWGDLDIYGLLREEWLER
jgi:RimJ/RimL family protein N-acetyltransferase